MSCTDPIADGLSSIRNGLMVGKTVVTMPHSSIKEDICRVLVEEGYLRRIEVLDTKPGRTMQVHLKYGKQGESVIKAITRISRPGRRVYRGKAELNPVLNGFGISVVSTSKGIMSDRACRAANLGGEVICEVR